MSEELNIIKEQLTRYQSLLDRLTQFAVDVIMLLRKLDNSVELRVIKYQLIKSCTSSGANYDEAQAASSIADFSNKIKISLKEMRESNYWIKIILKINDSHISELKHLLNESDELKKILGSIAVKTTKSRSR